MGLWAGVESLGPDGEMLSSLGLARTTWFLSESSVQGDTVGGDTVFVPEENSNQQFLKGIVDLAEVRVISSGLDSVVPT